MFDIQYLQNWFLCVIKIKNTQYRYQQTLRFVLCIGVEKANVGELVDRIDGKF